MKLRLLPVVLSVVITSAALFGGWFIYQSVAMENPLMSIVEKTNGVKHAQMLFEGNRVVVELALDPDASLREIYQKIVTEGASIIGKREVKLKVTNASSRELDRWWSAALFEVAEAMESKQYARIPSTLDKLAESRPNLKVATEMDDTNVYIRLTDGKHSKFVILPRTPEKIGVWPNE